MPFIKKVYCPDKAITTLRTNVHKINDEVAQSSSTSFKCVVDGVEKVLLRNELLRILAISQIKHIELAIQEKKGENIFIINY